jgi:hypothetical protein
MKFIRIITCLFLLGLVAVSCNKDVLEPIDVAADALSAEAARAALSEAERAFFDFDFAALNHAALANDPVGREGSLWVDKALEHILLQNHEHRFVPDLIGRTGYPLWSRAMQVDVAAAPQGKALLIPFAKLDEAFTRAVLLVFFESVDSEPGFILADKTLLLELIPDVPEASMPFALFFGNVMAHFDSRLFAHKNQPLLEWLDGQGEEDVLAGGLGIEYRCTVSVSFDVCRPPNIPFAPGGEEVSFRNCPEGHVLQSVGISFPCGGSLSFFFPQGGGPGPSGGVGSSPWWGPSNLEGGTSQGGSSSYGPAFGSEALSIDAFPQFQILNDLLTVCALAGETHEPGAPNDPAVEDLCNSLAALMGNSALGGAEIAWLLSYDLQRFGAVASWLANGSSALADETARAYIRFLQNGGEMAFKKFTGLYKTVSSLAAVLGLDWDRVLFLLENEDLALGIDQSLEDANTTQLQTEIDAAIISAKIITDLSMTERLEGPFDSQYDAVISQYANQFPEIYEEESYGIWPIALHLILRYHAREEAFFIRQERIQLGLPEWPSWKVWNEAYKRVYKADLHTGLDILGLFPVLGEPADLVNGILYVIEGDGENAALSFASMLPVAGWAATGAKYATILVSVGNKTYRFRNYVDAAGNITFSHKGRLREILDMGPAASDFRQAHHIVPEALWNNQLVQKAAKSRDGGSVFQMNGPHNGVPVSNMYHNGPHQQYSEAIQAELNRWHGLYSGVSPEVASQKLRQWQQALKDQIANSSEHINSIVPPLIPNP